MAPCELHWILEGKLAGSGRPGLFGSFEEDMKYLRGLGIRLVVTLTEEPLRPDAAELGFRTLHFPIPDMGIPTPRNAAGLCLEVVSSITRGEPVLLHCKAGLGRTGTMLACCLIALGMNAAGAMAHVRRICGGYIQSAAQEAFIAHFAELLGEEALRMSARRAR